MADTIVRLLQLAKDLLRLCENHMPIKKGQRLTKEQCCALILYRTIHELASDSVLMISNGRSISSPVLLRSLFEYHVEMLYLIDDPKRFEQRILDACREGQKCLNKIAESKHRSFSDIKNDPRLEDARSKLATILKEHEETKFWGICNKLGLDTKYNTVYRLLSAYAHPSMNISLNTHIAREDENGVLQYNPNAELYEDKAILYINLVKQILIDATEQIHRFIPDDIISAVKKELDKFCSLWDNSMPSANSK
ncbi:MAG: DUF5677 domain-containing protein [Sedimentisphaerales bacterium]